MDGGRITNRQLRDIKRAQSEIKKFCKSINIKDITYDVYIDDKICLKINEIENIIFILLFNKNKQSVYTIITEEIFNIYSWILK